MITFLVVLGISLVIGMTPVAADVAIQRRLEARDIERMDEP